ncbi:DUF6278 family protein [uncultured Friedmanniella sp.]|uniref:DUF6278 family protein n=1 Tax=uncultured Friedmanniella sp. TaxID=335381 RepID=UPI0035CB1A16
MLTGGSIHRWRRGHRRRTANGVGVFGGPGSADDPQALADLLDRHEAITRWAEAAGADLPVSTAGVRTVEALIDTWRDSPSPQLTNRVGLFLGTVMTREITGARWHLWPNGHPVVRLVTGEDVDVTALAAARVRSGRPSLTAVLERAAAADGPGPR